MVDDIVAVCGVRSCWLSYLLQSYGAHLQDIEMANGRARYLFIDDDDFRAAQEAVLAKIESGFFETGGYES